MKTRNIISLAVIAMTILIQGCEDNFSHINGEGRIITETLSVPEFTGIEVTGIEDVYISYGSTQEVVVKGHRNIVDRIQKKVFNDTWYMELEKGNYGKYELTYYITLPYFDYASNVGTGDINIEEPFVQDNVKINLEGTGSFNGFSMDSKHCTVKITGTGNCEVTATELLDVNLDGMGSVYYKGYPKLKADISGLGQVEDAN